MVDGNRRPRHEPRRVISSHPKAGWGGAFHCMMVSLSASSPMLAAGLVLGLAIASLVPIGEALAAAPEAEPTEGGDAIPESEPPIEPVADPDAPTEPDVPVDPDAPTDPDAAIITEDPGEGEAPADASADPDPPPDDASPGAPSGRFETDDTPVDEAQREEDRRAGRRLRARERDEGNWQVFAPYPELGPIRYRDPEGRRTLWMGIDAAGTYLPSTLGLADRAVWAVRPAGAWAFSLTPWLALGGRHEVAWYDADVNRLRVHAHQVELSSRPLAASRSSDALDDRLAIGVTTHAIRQSDVGTADVAGFQDTILHVGYGLDHLLGTRWRLGWQVQGRHAWVPDGTQRQVRVATRLAFHPRPAHRISLDAAGYYVNRNHHASSGPSGAHALARHSVLGQVGLGYSWVGRAGVGPWTHVRATSSFLSGEAPIYELREEALEAGYGEVLVGMLARWP